MNFKKVSDRPWWMRDDHKFSLKIFSLQLRNYQYSKGFNIMCISATATGALR